MTERSPFVRYLLRNLRLSALIIAAGVAAIVLYALVAGEEIAWDIAVFLSIGMTISSVLNAVIDARREENERGASL